MDTFLIRGCRWLSCVVLLGALTTAIAVLPAHAQAPESAPTTQVQSAADVAEVLQGAETDPMAEEVSLEEAGKTARNLGVRAFWAALVLTMTFVLVKAAVFVLDRLAERSARQRLLFKRLAPVVRLILWVFGFYVVVRGIFGVDATNLLAAATAIGVAVGFAAQDILKNIFGGLVIISDRPFQIGDKIRVGDTYGEVLSIGLRSTRIATPDDNLVTVPNSQIVSDHVSNANAGALDCQVVTDLYLPAWVDATFAKRLAYEAAASSQYVYLKKPIVVLVLDEFHHTFVLHLKVKAYVLDTRYEFLLMSDITERARRAFRQAGLISDTHGAQTYVQLPAQGPASGIANGAPGGSAPAPGMSPS